ncbi:unnamed protein product [Moneuplotes crassus]|uniref:Uncharacterized protein n=1 Tax=Euplotes crassus TaxID=5936 RepID=A0AAD1UP37_EUPCR|nr:unnamed protein product [Moneuplotes crassus]
MTQNTERSTVFSKIVGVRDISTDKRELEKSIMKELEERRKYKEPDIEEKEMEKLEISNEGKMRDLRPTNHSESIGRIKKRRASLPAKQYRKCFRKCRNSIVQITDTNINQTNPRKALEKFTVYNLKPYSKGALKSRKSQKLSNKSTRSSKALKTHKSSKAFINSTSDMDISVNPIHKTSSREVSKTRNPSAKRPLSSTVNFSYKARRRSKGFISRVSHVLGLWMKGKTKRMHQPCSKFIKPSFPKNNRIHKIDLDIPLRNSVIFTEKDDLRINFVKSKPRPKAQKLKSPKKIGKTRRIKRRRKKPDPMITCINVSKHKTTQCTENDLSVQDLLNHSQLLDTDRTKFTPKPSPEECKIFSRPYRPRKLQEVSSFHHSMISKNMF